MMSDDGKLFWNAAAMVMPLGGGRVRLFQPVMRRNLIAPLAFMPAIDLLQDGTTPDALREALGEGADSIAVDDATSFTIWDHVFRNPGMFDADAVEETVTGLDEVLEVGPWEQAKQSLVRRVRFRGTVGPGTRLSDETTQQFAVYEPPHVPGDDPNAWRSTHAKTTLMLDEDVFELVESAGRHTTAIPWEATPIALTPAQPPNSAPLEQSIERWADALADALEDGGERSAALPDDAFKAVTVDLPLNVGQAVLAQSPGAAFVLLSGQGADRTETSRVAFARFKGMAENALDQMDFARFHSFRPGYIYPVTPRQEPNFTYRLARLLYPALRAIYPNVGLPAPDLAWAMVEGAIAGTPGGAVVLENADIRAFAAARSAST